MFLKAGMESVFVLTGWMEDEVRAEFPDGTVTLIHDPDYDKQDMLASLKNGLSALGNGFDGILFTPVCIRENGLETVKSLLDAEGEICIPVTDGLRGHPVRFGRKTAERLLSYTGPLGIKGYFESVPEQVRLVETGDRDREAIREQITIRLTGKELFFGPGPRQLLLGVKSRGSVLEACQAIGVSYSKGRKMIRNMEKELGFQLVDRVQGGSNGGSARLTEKGERFLECFSAYEQDVKEYAGQIFNRYFQELEDRT